MHEAARRLALLAAGVLVVCAVLVQRVSAARFVDPSGGVSDCTNPGTPCGSITYAIEQAAAAGGDDVLVRQGTYLETVEVADVTASVIVSGGYDSQWRATSSSSVVAGSHSNSKGASIGLLISSSSGVSFKQITIDMANDTLAPGDSSYAVITDDAEVALTDVSLVPAPGGAGYHGADAVRISPGAAGGSAGQPGLVDAVMTCDEATRRAGGGVSSGTGCSPGGAGGNSGTIDTQCTMPQDFSATGGLVGAVGTGSDGGAGAAGAVCAAGGPGFAGGPGLPASAGGVGGDSSSIEASLANGLFVAQPGTDGTADGAAGGGGGGGGGAGACDTGSSAWGGGGGGGGEGGCPADQAGAAGGGGGGSFGLLALGSSSVKLTRCKVSMASGGNGGRGGSGVRGQEGGASGTPGSAAGSAAAGGLGGAGGEGGPSAGGGGGAGGPSVALYGGKSASITQSDVSITVGSASGGAGGLGGAGGDGPGGSAPSGSAGSVGPRIVCFAGGAKCSDTGLTLVEILVVVGVILALLGGISAAVIAVRRRGKDSDGEVDKAAAAYGFDPVAAEKAALAQQNKNRNTTAGELAVMYREKAERRSQKEIAARDTVAIEFGMSHVTLPLQLDLIPAPVRECVDFIDRYAIDEEGLFRISPSKRQMTELQNRFAADDTYRIPAPPETDLHTPAGMLKAFFREDPQSIVPDYFLAEFVRLSKEKKLSGAALVTAMVPSANNLPDYNRAVMEFIFRFLGRVAKHSSKNRMNLDNVAMVWGPCFVRGDPSAGAAFMGTCIRHVDALFGKERQMRFGDDSAALKPRDDNTSLSAHGSSGSAQHQRRNRSRSRSPASHGSAPRGHRRGDSLASGSTTGSPNRRNRDNSPNRPGSPARKEMFKKDKARLRRDSESDDGRRDSLSTIAKLSAHDNSIVATPMSTYLEPDDQRFIVTNEQAPFFGAGAKSNVSDAGRSSRSLEASVNSNNKRKGGRKGRGASRSPGPGGERRKRSSSKQRSTSGSRQRHASRSKSPVPL